ncbi:xanthine dehydrogenase [Endozoicomonas montiporae]|uniref:Xanthine dehydrogenase n=2 Tax=Endozoicomonas montiporae TaxID=1027273 RepID=A0A081N4S6_9GAMM|nr:xanthine dehydrogenase subunit XdhB [Endozoicomonas montiporae]AMO57682.1 xanthine dehydrogenase FAD-binding subunit [Endozoicomonas montiporae CL-33]KEQ13449.1 xanthine dehydrogenase [Endozoicomonas montiporae]
MFSVEQYFKADSIDSACAYLAEHSDARLIAGGTDVLIRLREGKPEFRHLVDIQSIDALQQLTVDSEGRITIGASVTISRLIQFLKQQKLCKSLIEGASSLGGPQVRNMATVGGNICNGAPSADTAAPLLTYNAELTIQSQQGARVVPMESFYQGPGKVDLKPGELVTAITINPEQYQNTGSHFYKYAMRKAMDIATIGCAASCELESSSTPGKQRVKELRIAYTVAAPVPKRCRTAEGLAKHRTVDASLIDELAAVVLEDLSPRNSWRAAKDFREHIIRTLARRVVTEAITRAGGEL